MPEPSSSSKAYRASSCGQQGEETPVDTCKARLSDGRTSRLTHLLQVELLHFAHHLGRMPHRTRARARRQQQRSEHAHHPLSLRSRQPALRCRACPDQAALQRVSTLLRVGRGGFPSPGRTTTHLSPCDFLQSCQNRNGAACRIQKMERGHAGEEWTNVRRLASSASDFSHLRGFLRKWSEAPAVTVQYGTSKQVSPDEELRTWHTRLNLPWRMGSGEV